MSGAPDRETSGPVPEVTYRRHPAGRRLLRRAPWENAATAVIVLGIVMLMQPVSLTLYAYSFVTILAGTVGFIIFSHFPE